jgi:PIF1-like helicase
MGTVEVGGQRGRKEEVDGNETKEGDNNNSGQNTSRRGTNARFPFMPRTSADGDILDSHPLQGSHEQMVQSKQSAPLLAGPAPPSLQCLDGLGDMYEYKNMDRATQRSLDYAALYYLTLLSPWDLEEGIPEALLDKTKTPYEALCNFTARLFPQDLNDCLNLSRSEKWRGAYMRSVSGNLRVKKKKLDMFTRHRYRHTSKWENEALSAARLQKYFFNKWGMKGGDEDGGGHAKAATWDEGDNDVDDEGAEVLERRENEAALLLLSARLLADNKADAQEKLTDAYLNESKDVMEGFLAHANRQATHSIRTTEQTNDDCIYLKKEVPREHQDTHQFNCLQHYMWSTIIDAQSLPMLSGYDATAEANTTTTAVQEEAKEENDGVSGGAQRSSGVAMDGLHKFLEGETSVTTDQRTLLELICTHLDNAVEGEQLLLMVLGGPGVGKTWCLKTFRRLLKHLNRPDIFGAAFMGTAASNIPGAGTINRSFDIPVAKKNKQTNVSLSTPRAGTAARLSLQWEKCQFMVVDEISMADAVLVGKMDQRARQVLKNDLPFGGKHVLFFGDFFQIPPTTGHPLYTSILRYHGVVGKTYVHDSTPLARGAHLLSLFKYVSLEQQVRASECEKQKDFVSRGRSFSDKLIDDALLASKTTH